jgi:hypothetical protein
VVIIHRLHQSGLRFKRSRLKWIKSSLDPHNAACEGFFGRLKTELFYPRDWQATSIAQFIQAVDSYIRWYNEKRIKISLGSLSPLQYRESLGLTASPVQVFRRTPGGSIFNRHRHPLAWARCHGYANDTKYFFIFYFCIYYNLQNQFCNSEFRSLQQAADALRTTALWRHNHDQFQSPAGQACP